MIDVQPKVELANVTVMATSGRGFTPEEVAERALDKLMYVSDSAPQEIRDQAREYRAHIQQVLIHYMKEAIKSDRTTLINKFIEAGHPELTDLLRI
jgi:hypothetical protein